MAAPTRAERNTEIIRLKKLSSRIHVRKVDHYLGETGILFNVLINDNRLPPDNEAMSAVDVDAKVARVTVRPGKWVEYEPGSGGASTYVDCNATFTETTGGGCSSF
jgi:hypothetical protein